MVIKKNILSKTTLLRLIPGILGLLFATSLVNAQNFTFKKPVRLSRNINSIAEESMPILNKTSDTLFFVRSLYQGNNGGKTSGQDIWMSVLKNGSWSYAQNNFPSLNNYRNNAVVGIDSSGTVLYLLDSYSAAGNKLSGIAKSKFQNKIYSEPVSIKVKGLEAKNSFVGFYMEESEDVLLVSMDGPESLGQEDLYVSVKDEYGEWTAPINLGPTINTEGFEISPFLSKDGKILFFASNGHNGYGDADIFMSRRLYDNSWVLWSKPINLGEQINSSGFDGYLCMSDDNEMVYFVSNRNSTNTDIYSSEVVKVNEEELRAEINPSKYQLTETEIQSLLGMPVTRKVYFDFGSFELKQSSKELLNFLIEKLKENRKYNIELIGHTDNEGSEEFNLELSRRRAQQVEGYMIDAGITPGRISTKGVGESELLYQNGSPEEMAKNRRVEIFFTKEIPK